MGLPVARCTQCGDVKGHGKEPASPLSCPLRRWGLPLSAAPSSVRPWLLPGKSAGAVQDQEGCQPLPSPGAVSRDPRLMVRGHTVRTSRLVRSSEVVALTVMGASCTPSEGVKRGKQRHWAARTGSARPSWVGSCRHGSSRVRAAGITTLCRSPWSQSSWFAVPANGCGGGGDALDAACYVPLQHPQVRSLAQSGLQDCAHRVRQHWPRLQWGRTLT